MPYRHFFMSPLQKVSTENNVPFTYELFFGTGTGFIDSESGSEAVLDPVRKDNYTDSVTNLKRGEALLGPAGQVNMHTSSHT